MLRVCLVVAGLGISALMAPAQAQSLSSGDYERCAVYRPDGSRAGYSNACLERQRAAIRHYTNRHTNTYSGGYRPAPAAHGYQQAAYPCPAWANNGRGYSSTSISGGYGVQYGTFTASVNGQPCIPTSGNQFLRGVN
jgi:hypothetical protein